MATPQANTPVFPTHAAAVTPSDSVTFEDSAIYVGTGGTVVVLPAGSPDSAAVTFVNVPDASVLPVMCRAVRATGTTALNLVRIR